MTIARGFKRLWRNEFTTFLSQCTTHEALAEAEIHARPPGTPFTTAERAHFEKWHLPELGFRNYWYPVMMSSDLTSRPVKRRLLGETIAFWRDGGKAYAIANRCPHRGGSLSNGHVRFPGSGTLSCPYHGWTFDGQTGELRACIQEGPNSVMLQKGVRTTAYPVEERLGLVWVWIGALAPVPVEEDIPVTMNQPGVANFIHFTNVWKTNWALLADNFSDGLHAPYLHRAAPQYLLNRLPIRAQWEEPHYAYLEHDGKVLEELRRPLKTGPAVDEAAFPGLGRFPRHKWWRVRPPRRKPTESYITGYEPRSFIHGLPSYVGTPHEENYLTMFAIPIDRDHVYGMVALSGKQSARERLWWRFYFPIWQLTHSTVFLGQDHRVLSHIELGPERLTGWDRDVVTWRRFAVQNARDYLSANEPRDASESMFTLDALDGVPGHGTDRNGEGSASPTPAETVA